ncbi:hypothetical protein FHW20_004503 [Ochrobactrum intermedium]|uniref:Uncharacterized protein n=1 Tax=Brucella intermedia TaxID=94625 RepID=A0ABR6AWC1_9HYPH|nr:hypothetical protein [Brucella intermedia]
MCRQAEQNLQRRLFSTHQPIHHRIDIVRHFPDVVDRLAGCASVSKRSGFER